MGSNHAQVSIFNLALLFLNGPGLTAEEVKVEGNQHAHEDPAAELLPSNRASLCYHVGTTAALKPILRQSFANDDDEE